MKFAIVRIKGKQYKVSQGDLIKLEKLDGKKGDKLIFDEVLLLVAADDNVKIGTPLVEKTTVEAEIVRQFKGTKIRVAKFKAKSRYRRVQGHRQQLTEIKIISIGPKSQKPVVSKSKATVKKAVSKKTTTKTSKTKLKLDSKKPVGKSLKK